MNTIIIPNALLIKNLPVPECWQRDWWKILGRHTDPNAKRPTRFYNPSIIRIKGDTWMAYRCDQPAHMPFTWIAAVQLDPKTLLPIWQTNKHVAVPSKFDGMCVEDPRLFHGSSKDIWLSYTDGKRMALARVDAMLCFEEGWYVETDFQLQSVEKNWSFFYDGTEIRCIYECSPHTTLTLNWRNEHPFMSKDGISNSHPLEAFWRYGKPRGGAPPVLHNGAFWHFFHSHTEHNGQRKYFAGVYTFEPRYPFKPISITTAPILIGTPDKDRLNQPFGVVFPAGAIRTDNGWLVSYGINDEHCAIASISDGEIKLVDI